MDENHLDGTYADQMLNAKTKSIQSDSSKKGLPVPTSNGQDERKTNVDLVYAKLQTEELQIKEQKMSKGEMKLCLEEEGSSSKCIVSETPIEENALLITEENSSGNKPFTPENQQPRYILINPSSCCVVMSDKGTPVLVLANSLEKGPFERTLNNQPSLQHLDNITQENQGLSLSELTDHTSKRCDKILSRETKEIFVCEVPGCGRSFNTLSYMKYHQSAHSGHKALQCTVDGCGRKFAWSAHLKYHQLTHTGQRLYQCTNEDCGASFYTSQRLAVHQRTHTGEKPFMCKEQNCGKSFTTAGNLKNHARIHTGERPFKCDIQGCPRKFSEQSSLRKHKLAHSGAKPYICKICGKSFSQSGSRNVHMKRHELQQHATEQDISRQNADEGMVVELDPNDVLVLKQIDDDMQLHLQDFQGSESVVFSNPVADHIVTVTTQPSEEDVSNNGIQGMLCNEEETLGHIEVLNDESAITNSKSSGANVVVMSQPEEMVTMSAGYHHHTPQGAEEIVYDNDLLHTSLESEEISHSLTPDSLHHHQHNVIIGAILQHEDVTQEGGQL